MDKWKKNAISGPACGNAGNEDVAAGDRAPCNAHALHVRTPTHTRNQLHPLMLTPSNLRVKLHAMRAGLEEFIMTARIIELVWKSNSDFLRIEEENNRMQKEE